jgi:hypothetical protein
MNPRLSSRRRLPALALLLPLLLLLAQQGALQHELGHLARAARAQHAQLTGTQTVGEQAPCLECRAFAQIAHPAAASAAISAAPAAAPLLAPKPRFVVVSADAPAPRSRGPPQA